MKQTKSIDFLLDVFERFGKTDAQAALDFVTKNTSTEGEIVRIIGVDANTGQPIAQKPFKEAVSKEVQAIDLGLPSGTLWADRNVGAKSPEDYGAFFSWGNTDPHYPNKENMDWGDDNEAFDYHFGSDNYEKTEGYKLEGDIDLEHDAARINMGEPWQMPTSDQFQELYDNCDWVRKTQNGVNGYLVTSKINGASIFFACSGNGDGASWNNRGSSGYYWSSSLDSATDGRHLYFGSGGVYPQYNYRRFYGFAVRAVQNIVSNK